jgi:NAD(P)-dependent dehydrogenase (short-subunit alcohol dehydrogenase family)
MDNSSISDNGPIVWTAADMPDQGGRVAVVTGASSGLGRVIAQELAAHGATVVMAVRDPEKGKRVVSEFLSSDPSGRFDVRRLDLMDLASVRDFVTDLEGDHPTIDLLVNNAGIGGGKLVHSAQGYEATFATNFLGHFALTGLLLEALGRGREPRVVHIGSNLYQRIKVDLPIEDPRGEHGYKSLKAYAASKLAQMMFGVELERRLRDVESPLRSLVAHPGVANTPMQERDSLGEAAVAKLVNIFLGRPPERAAISLLYAATAPEASADLVPGPSLNKRDNRIHLEPLHPPADDRALAGRLWEAAEDFTGVEVNPSGAAR